MIDLYSSSTPNGRKITILLEELGIDYNPIFVSLDKNEQFSEIVETTAGRMLISEILPQMVLQQI